MTAPIRLNVKVLPRSSRDQIVGKDKDGTLKIKVTAPPRDGKANSKVLNLLSKELNIPKSKISIVSGQTSRDKVIEIVGARFPRPVDSKQ